MTRDANDPVIATDLVEYFVLTIPDPQDLAQVVPGLQRLVASATIRILDLVVVRVDERGVAAVVSPEDRTPFAAALDLGRWDGVLLSTHDIEMIALALRPGDVAVVVVAEDRWAEPLAAAARGLGGEIRAGERISRERVQAALDRAPSAPEEGR